MMNSVRMMMFRTPMVKLVNEVLFFNGAELYSFICNTSNRMMTPLEKIICSPPFRLVSSYL